MKITLRVTYTDDREPASVTAGTRDVLAWEAKFSRNWTRLLEDTTLTDKCFLAWSALHGRDGTPTLDEWVDGVDFVAIVEAGDPVPLDPTASTGT
jgi:hypothetical protein